MLQITEVNGNIANVAAAHIEAVCANPEARTTITKVKTVIFLASGKHLQSSQPAAAIVRAYHVALRSPAAEIDVVMYIRADGT